METCGWFRIEAAQPVGSSPKGELYALSINGWESHYKEPAPRTGGEESIAFVFCSKQRPAVIFFGDYQSSDRQGPKWWAFFIQPGNSEAIAGVSETAYAIYWAACHNAEVHDVYEEGETLGRRFGYPFSPGTEKDLAGGFENRCQAYPETVICRGTGFASCEFLWRRVDTLIEVHTVGEDDPPIVSSVRCRANC